MTPPKTLGPALQDLENFPPPMLASSGDWEVRRYTGDRRYYLRVRRLEIVLTPLSAAKLAFAVRRGNRYAPRKARKT